MFECAQEADVEEAREQEASRAAVEEEGEGGGDEGEVQESGEGRREIVERRRDLSSVGS